MKPLLRRGDEELIVFLDVTSNASRNNTTLATTTNLIGR
jgi:hypothetical protein